MTMDEKTKTLLDAIEARWRKTTPGPIDVHRIDQHDGTIAYQLQQADGAPKARTDRDDDLLIGARVLTQFDDLDNPDARWDAEACAKAYEDVPALIALVREQLTENAALRALACSVESNEDWRAEVLVLRERLAKLESLGPWLEANRVAQLKWADDAKQRGDVNWREQCMILEARADAFKQAGYELSNRAGKDLRGEAT